MNGNGTDRIVHLLYSIHKLDGDADENTRDNANDHGGHRVDETRGGGDRDEAGKQTVTAHRGIGFAVAEPHVEHGSERASHAREHGVYSD